MTQTITIAIFTFGSILLLIGILGGRFKIFGAEINDVTNTPIRVIAFIVGAALIVVGIAKSDEAPELSKAPLPKPEMDAPKASPQLPKSDSKAPTRGDILQDRTIQIASGSCSDPKNTDREGYNNPDCTWLRTFLKPSRDNTVFKISLVASINMSQVGCNDPHRMAEVFLSWSGTTESRSGLIGQTNVSVATQTYSLNGEAMAAGGADIPIKVFVNPRGCTKADLSSGVLTVKEVQM